MSLLLLLGGTPSVAYSDTSGLFGGPMTLSALRDEVLNWLDEGDAVSTDAIWTTATNAIRNAHTLRLTEEKWPFMLWDRQETITLTASQRAYSLHQEFYRPLYVRNRTRKTWLMEMPGRNIEPSGINFTADIDTDRYTIWGRSPVKSQPSAESLVTIISTAGTDTTLAKSITIRGDTSDGVTTEIIRPNGTNAVAGTVPFTKILEVTKPVAWAGTLRMTSNEGAVTNLTLFPNEYARSYVQLNLLYLPSAGEILEYQFYRQPNILAQEGSVTNIPPPFERIIVFDALLLMAAYDNRLDGGRASVWKEMRDNLDFALRQAMMEGSSLAAEPRFIRDAYWPGIPRINDLNS